MRVAAWLAVALVTGGAAMAQSGRQGEVERVAPLYSIDLTHGDWQHEVAPICPAFTRYSFVYYHRSPQAGVRTAFMAVVPKQGGRVELVPITGRVSALPAPVAASQVTIKTFNDVFQDELRHGGNGRSVPGLTWAGFAQCYAGLVGEQPVIPPVDPALPAVEAPLDLGAAHVSSILIPVAAPGEVQRAVSVRVDAHGVLTGATVSESVPVKRVQ